MRKFHELFAGRDDVYGTYAVSGASKSTEKGQKRTGRAKTITDTKVDEALYQKHLDGEQSLGVVPIRLNGTVSWFAIDVDTYGDDTLHKKMAAKVNRLNLPLVPFNSKSGGLHLFCFLTEPASAADVRESAEKYVAALGLPKRTEIFPKQEAISQNDAGSWINLPYFGDTRKCMGYDGETELSLKEFLIFAADREVHPSDLGHRTSELDHHETGNVGEMDDGGAPPCVVKMLEEGIEEGGRDNALCHIAVFLKRADPDNWQDRLAEINEESVHPALPMSDILRIVKGAERKEYQYLCKQSPMVAMCDKKTCFKRKFGIGDGEGDYANFAIDSLRKIGDEEPYYVIVIDGKPIKVQSDVLMSFTKLRKAIFEKLNKLVQPLKPKEWETRLADAMLDMEQEEAPEEVSTGGAVTSMFVAWTTQRLNGIVGTKDRIGDGQPFYDGKSILFRGTDFLAYVRRNSNRMIDDRIIWLTLNEEGAEQTREEINGRPLRLWSYPVAEPWFDIQGEDEGAF